MMIDRQTSSLAPLCPKEAVLVVQLKKLAMTDRNRIKKKSEWLLRLEYVYQRIKGYYLNEIYFF